MDLPNITDLIRAGSQNLWVMMPAAITLGALHGLEPGHSKTVMAAFIVAVRGTVRQALLLGLSATLSHTAVVWLVAVIGLTIGQQFITGGQTEAWFQGISGLIMIAIGLWMALSIWKAAPKSDRHNHDHDHDHDHEHGHDHDHESEDAHARAHAEAIKSQFGSGKATNLQIIIFGLTGGLIPCPASITVLLVCLQLKKVALGLFLVLGFSIGLAVTLVAVGVGTALMLKHATQQVGFKGSRFETYLGYAPLISAALILSIGTYSIVTAITGHAQ